MRTVLLIGLLMIDYHATGHQGPAIYALLFTAYLDHKEIEQ